MVDNNETEAVTGKLAMRANDDTAEKVRTATASSDRVHAVKLSCSAASPSQLPSLTARPIDLNRVI